MRKPNTSAAVQAGRKSSRDELDDFPTPPWATRALCEIVLGPELDDCATVWEPCANRGHMVRPLREYVRDVVPSDVYDYGVGFHRFDFLSLADTLMPRQWPGAPKRLDWLITNPPFKHLNDFIEHAQRITVTGFAIFGRIQMLESLGRYADFYGRWDPAKWGWCQFVERVNIVHGRLLERLPDGGTMPQAYGWLVYMHNPPERGPTWWLERRMIPPCQKRLTRPGDYTTDNVDAYAAPLV